MEQFIFRQEMAMSGAPGVGGMGVQMFGPTLIVHGNAEQKAEHLPRILSGEVAWCQGYSEPGSGSDLASLQTRAVKDGDDYVINGQKIWTTLAHMSQYMLLLARTDPDVPKHKGLSYFIVPMNSPGVTVRPLMNMAGTHEFNEVFFDNVRIPAKNLVGEQDRGWYQAVTTLDIERSNIGSAVGQQQTVEDLVRFAKENKSNGVVRIKSDPMLRTELAERFLETEVAMSLSSRVVSMQSKGMIPNYEAAAVKLYSMELNQRIANTGVRLMGMYGALARGSKRAAMKGRMSYSYIRNVANTIEGGTSEVQRNIVAQRGLGLPRE
jgi:alkylation response protein AidB-like acyl-CoA dehydrogenase